MLESKLASSGWDNNREYLVLITSIAVEVNTFHRNPIKFSYFLIGYMLLLLLICVSLLVSIGWLISSIFEIALPIQIQ